MRTPSFTIVNAMKHTITLPDRPAIRIAMNCSIAAWARARDLTPASVHMFIQRYAGKTVDMSRPWGGQTRRTLLALDETLQAAERDAA